MAEPGDPLHLAQRALARRELTPEELRRRLRRAGVPAEAVEQALSRLREVGYLSEERAAEERARVLCRRGYGDARIRLDLAARGVSAEILDAVVEALPPEDERASLLLARLGSARRASSALRRRGFSEDTIERVLSGDVADAP